MRSGKRGESCLASLVVVTDEGRKEERATRGVRRVSISINTLPTLLLYQTNIHQSTPSPSSSIPDLPRCLRRSQRDDAQTSNTYRSQHTPSTSKARTTQQPPPLLQPHHYPSSPSPDSHYFSAQPPYPRLRFFPRCSPRRHLHPPCCADCHHQTSHRCPRTCERNAGVLRALLVLVFWGLRGRRGLLPRR
jgi:hypothetical protein